MTKLKYEFHCQFRNRTDSCWANSSPHALNDRVKKATKHKAAALRSSIDRQQPPMLRRRLMPPGAPSWGGLVEGSRTCTDRAARDAQTARPCGPRARAPPCARACPPPRISSRPSDEPPRHVQRRMPASEPARPRHPHNQPPRFRP